MALQTPLVLISGAFSTLPPGDTIGPATDPVAQASGNAALVLAGTALASGNAGISTGLTALASGNAGISTGLTALASGNAGLVSASNKVPISGGYMTGQLFAASGVVVSGTLSRNGFNVVTVGDVETVTSTMIASGTIIDADVNISGAINATKLNFLQAGASGVARTVDSKLKDTVSVKDFGTVGDGIADDTAAIQAAIVAARASLRTLLIPGGTYKITSSLTLTDQDWFIGCGKDKTVFNYTGSSSAIIASAWNGKIEGISIHTSQNAANGIEVGNNSRNCSIENVYLQSAGGSATGAGFYLNAGTGFSGGLTIHTSYALQFKYGVKMVGTVLATDTWTTVSMYNLWLVGYGPSVVSGSAGVYMDALTNGVGTVMYGGTIEAFATGIQTFNGGYGGVFETDLEGNTADYSVGNSFNGRIISAIGGKGLQKGTNGTANVWFQDRQTQGVSRAYEDRYSPKHVTYDAGQGLQEEIWYRNASIIDGNSLDANAIKFAIGLGYDGTYGPSVHPNQHYINVGGQKINWATAIPTTETWKRGDIRYNLNATLSGYVGWVCTAAGTPGTWNTFGLIT